MNSKERKTEIIKAVDAKGWTVERIDLRQQTLRIAKDGRRVFVEIWRGMSNTMLEDSVSRSIHSL